MRNLKVARWGIALASLSLVSSALAVELMKWERIPLPVALSVGQERIVFVERNVRVGFPPALSGKLRIQSSGGTVYLQASEAFEQTRLKLVDVESGEVILLDVVARADKKAWEPVQLVYSGEVSSVSERGQEKTSGQSVQPEAATPSGASSLRQPAPLNGPLPVVLTRYAAQSLYAPLRVVEPVPGIRPVTLRLPARLTTVYPSEAVDVTPLAAWGLQSLNVVALKIRNRASQKVVLDPRMLQGRFISAAFQHRWLGAAGTPEDTTTLYLVVAGRPDNAFIAEPVLPTSGKAVKKGGRDAD